MSEASEFHEPQIESKEPANVADLRGIAMSALSLMAMASNKPRHYDCHINRTYNSVTHDRSVTLKTRLAQDLQTSLTISEMTRFGGVVVSWKNNVIRDKNSFQARGRIFVGEAGQFVYSERRNDATTTTVLTDNGFATYANSRGGQDTSALSRNEALKTQTLIDDFQSFNVNLE